MKRTLGLLFMSCLLISPIMESMAQQNSAVDSLFNRGISEYRSGNYTEALKMFQLLDRIYPDHNRKTACFLMEAKSFYKLKKYRKALSLFSELEYSYPKSEYVDDALYGMANVYFKMGEYTKSIEKLLALIDKRGDERLRRKAAKFSLEIMQNYISDDDLIELLSSINSERGKAVLTMQLGKRYINSHQYQAAKKVLQRYLDTYKGSSYVVQIEELYRRADKMGKGVLKIGVILPLSGQLAQEGQSVLNGIRYGIDKHNESNGAKIELIVRDSKSDIIASIKETQELCGNSEVSVIIGELESNVSAAVAAVCQEESVPLLIPAATKDGLSSIGSFIFQLRSDVATKGKTIADYAVSGLGLKRFVSIAPADDYGKSMQHAFVSSAKELGADILSEQWYYGGAENLKSQFKDIRKSGIQEMIKDSLLVIVPEEEFKDLYEENPIVDGVIHVNKEVADLVDSTNLKINTIDGLFLPVYTDDLQYVIPQVSFYNISGKLFGGSFWYDEDILNKNRNYCNGVIFVSDYFSESSNYKFYKFRDSFRIKFHKTPGRLEILGYDSISMLLSVTGDLAEERKVIRDKLAKVKGFEGLGGYISFSDKRVNTFVHILQYRDGKIYRIK